MKLVVKTRDGTPVTHDVTGNVVGIKKPDGEIVDFVPAADVPEAVETTVELDFSAGPMVVEPGDGQAFSLVNIPVPEGLEPANIPIGTIIAGIAGAREDGGGGGNLVIAGGTGYATLSGNSVTIEHKLGVVPDIFIVRQSLYQEKYAVSMVIGFSAAARKLLGPHLYGDYSIWGIGYMNSGHEPIGTTTDGGIDTYPTTGTQFMRAATETEIILGSSTFKNFLSGSKLQWLAIGGLT